jgi:hypothetical protein
MAAVCYLSGYRIICFFTAPSPLHSVAIASMLGYRFASCNSFLRRSNFYPADFLPEPPNLSFKEPSEA